MAGFGTMFEGGLCSRCNSTSFKPGEGDVPCTSCKPGFASNEVRTECLCLSPMFEGEETCKERCSEEVPEFVVHGELRCVRWCVPSSAAQVGTERSCAEPCAGEEEGCIANCPGGYWTKEACVQNCSDLGLFVGVAQFHCVEHASCPFYERRESDLHCLEACDGEAHTVREISNQSELCGPCPSPRAPGGASRGAST